MRESIGATWLFGLIIGITMMFVGYLVVMINYSTVFKVKNEVVNIIEKYEGLGTTGYTPGSSGSQPGSIWIINKYLVNSAYRATGKCPDGWYGEENIDESSYGKLTQNNSSNNYYCVNYVNTGSNTGYFEVKLFLKMDIPVLGRLGAFQINGQTIEIKYPNTEGIK